MAGMKTAGFNTLIAADFPGLMDVENALHSIFDQADGITRNACMALKNSGGKRIRPAMVILSGLCFSKLSENMINTGVAAELIHMASLVHDDVIDQSLSRRGRSTINAVYGNHCAVLTGDFLFARAFKILSSCKLIKSMEYLTNAISQMCDGEINQDRDSFNPDITVDDYLDRIGRKTGILISSCCTAGAAAAGADQIYIDILQGYGMDVGCAFQIIDDILDFTGDEAKLGKPTGMDIINGDITLPVIFLLEDSKNGMKMRRIIENRCINRESLKAINDMLCSSGAIDKAFDVARDLIGRAKQRVSLIPDSSYKPYLMDIADNVLMRNN